MTYPPKSNADVDLGLRSNIIVTLGVHKHTIRFALMRLHVWLHERFCSAMIGDSNDTAHYLVMLCRFRRSRETEATLEIPELSGPADPAAERKLRPALSAG